MKRLLFFLFVFMFSLSHTGAQESLTSFKQGKIGTSIQTDEVMSKEYWDIWNPEVQARIDRDIEQYRKANALLKFKDLPAGAEVMVNQISHDFKFGANIFNFNQLGTVEHNRKYKELFGTLFNSATISFYWKKFEMEPNMPRFREEYWDTEKYWNQVKEPELEPHWRRPATDPVVEFCESKSINIHGHPIIWSAPEWHHPEWIFEQFCPEEEKEALNKLGRENLAELTPTQIKEIVPIYTNEVNRLFEKRIVELAEYYNDRIHSWDVVNESRDDFPGNSVTGNEIWRSRRAGILMPGDYTYHGFRIADRVFPNNVLLNINDNVLWNRDYYDIYIKQIKDLLSNGIRIDILGSQMHLFLPQQCLDIAKGKHIETPDIVWKKMETLSKAGLPIHLSEITITSPGDDEWGHEIQAVIARNLYRLWFSIEKMMGITWWNVVDGCGAPGEPAISGLFTRSMEPKSSFYALNKLINEEWKTNEIIKVREDGTATFRGFKGRYIVSWKDRLGIVQHVEFYLKNDDDGFLGGIIDMD